jgi:hypothetical protein
MAGVIVREFEPGDAEAFRDLNVEWIERYFKLEQSDRDVYGIRSRPSSIRAAAS